MAAAMPRQMRPPPVPGGEVRSFSFFEELAEPAKKVVVTAWKSRGKLFNDIRANVVLVLGSLCSMPKRAAKVVGSPKLQELIAEQEDPEAFAAVVFGSGGALCLGSMGAVIGATVGGVTGAVVGIVPALLTFGLSIPIGGCLGTVGGLTTGATVAGSAGFAAGATSGAGVAYFRAEIRHFAVTAGSLVYDVYDTLLVKPVTAVRSTSQRVRERVHDGAEYTRAKARAAGEALGDVASDQRVQVSAACAGIGAATVGTAGATGGALAGGAAGALVGVVPALFTFGLSIPIGAFAGGAAGLLAGGVAGTSMGFTGGGTAAYVWYKYRRA